MQEKFKLLLGEEELGEFATMTDLVNFKFANHHMEPNTSFTVVQIMEQSGNFNDTLHALVSEGNQDNLQEYLATQED